MVAVARRGEAGAAERALSVHEGRDVALLCQRTPSMSLIKQTGDHDSTGLSVPTMMPYTRQDYWRLTKYCERNNLLGTLSFKRPSSK